MILQLACEYATAPLSVPAAVFINAIPAAMLSIVALLATAVSSVRLRSIEDGVSG
jgi:hypothetical protein